MSLFTLAAATVLSMCFNFANTPSDEVINNAESSNAKVCKVEVYQNKNLSPKFEYRLSYDGQNRLVNKEAYKWNTNTMDWEHYYAMTYNYSEGGYTIARSYWDSKTQAYKLPTFKAIYQIEQGKVVSVANYKLDNKKSTYVLTDKIIITGQEKG